MKTNNQGIVTLIFLLIMALIATLILIIGQSRLLLALQRGKSASDTIITSYQAEYEINDLLARLNKGTLTQSDFAQFPINKAIGPNFHLTIDGRIEGNNQILTVTSQRAFATSKIQAVRAVQSASNTSEIDLVLMLDCTGSMNQLASNTAATTRMYEQGIAAMNFVQQMADHPNGDFIHLGVGTFSNNSEWLTTASGQQIRPDSNISFEAIKAAIDYRLNTTREDSSGCDSHRGYTNIGGGYNFAQDYFKSSPLTNAEKVEVLITDGEPTARTEDSACTPSLFCENCESEAMKYLACVITKNDTKWNGVDLGKRDPEVTIFAITVLDPPRNDVKTLFERAIGAENYFTSRNATDLTAQLDKVFDQIIEGLTKTTISRVIPLEEE